MNQIDESEPKPYRVDRELLKGDLPILALLLLDLLYGLFMLPKLPGRVPTHWSLSGEPDAYGPPYMNALGMPAIGVGIYLLLLFVPLIDPRRRNYAVFGDTLRFFRLALALFFVGLHVVVLRASMGSAVKVDFIVRLTAGILLIALGNRFGRVRQNFFFGIRVPWTVMSEEVWNRTHRFAGKLWVAGGALLVLAAFLPGAAGFGVFIALVVVLVIVPIAYSWRIYERLPRDAGARSTSSRKY